MSKNYTRNGEPVKSIESFYLPEDVTRFLEENSEIATSKNYKHHAIKSLESDLLFIGKKVKVTVLGHFDIEGCIEGILESVHISWYKYDGGWLRWCSIRDDKGYLNDGKELIGEIVQV